MYQFNVQTDHEASQRQLLASATSGKLALGELALSEFKYNIVNHGSIKNLSADSMSSRPIDETHKSKFNDDILFMEMTTSVAKTDKA